MKNKILLTIGLLMFFTSVVSSHGVTQNVTRKEMVSVWSSPQVHEFSNILTREYEKLHPELQFRLESLDNVLAEKLNETRGLAFVSEESDILVPNNSLLKVIVARDVIVPVINMDNPFISMMEQNGVSADKIKKAITNGATDWSSIVNNATKEPFHIYFLNDESAQSAISSFLDLSPEVMGKVDIKTTPDMIGWVQKDKYAVGFCRLVDIINSDRTDVIEGIKLLPIDKNGNGHIDYHEKIYGNLDDFKRGVWIGKYPKSLVNNIYSVSLANSDDENITAFLSWVVTDGQKFVEPGGFSELLYNERLSRLEKLNPPQIVLENQEPQSAKSRTLLYASLGILVVLIFAGIVVFQNQKRKSRVPLQTNPKRHKVFDESLLSFPNGLFFDKSHTWVFMEKEGKVKFGIDEFISSITGDYTRVILKSPGDRVKRKEPVVTLVQKGKQINIHAPVSGTVTEINEALVADPFTINHSPYNDGWIYMIEPSNWLREIQFFKMGESYKEWITSEITRLKDFLACSFNIKNLAEGNLAFQEGGELISQPLKNLGPEVWEDFQNYFIETSEMY